MGKIRRYQVKAKERFPNCRPDGTKQCVWCGKELEGRRLRWCSAECVEDYRGNHDWGYIRRQAYKRDQGICAICGIDTDCEKERWLKVFRFRNGPNKHPNWATSIDPEYWEVLARHGWDGFKGDWWNADHVVPREQGGPDTVDNLRTLCAPCHKGVTAIQAAERAKRKKEQANDQMNLEAME